MKNKIAKTILLCLVSTPSFSANHLVYMGGGGEPDGNSTIFDQHISSIGKVTSKSKWTYEATFNGGHSKTENLLKKSFPNPVSPITDFNRSAFNKIISETKIKLSSGTLNKDDQLIIIIDTHGAQRESELTHQISLSGKTNSLNYNTLEGSLRTDLDELQEIVKLSESRGVKLAIVDLSCHSGSTLNLVTKNNKNTCIISSSGPEHFGYTGGGSFTNNFINNLSKDNISLEEAFLEARRGSKDAAYPLINTQNSELAKSEFYRLISPYLNSQIASNLGKLHEQVLMMNDPINQCVRQSQFDSLIQKLNELDNLSGKAFQAKNGLIEDLKEYHNLQLQMLHESKKLGVDKLKEIESFKSIEINPKTNTPYFNLKLTWGELASIDKNVFTSSSTKNLEKNKNDADFPQRKMAMDKTLAQIFTKIDAIHKQYPNLKNSYASSLEFSMKVKDTFSLSEKIGKKEKQIYDAIYHSIEKESNHPCQQIKM